MYQDYDDSHDESDTNVTSGSESTSQPLDLSIETGQPTGIIACKDRWNGVFLIFVYMGIAGSVPWNFFINAEGYWQYKFRDVNQTESDPTKRTDLQTNFGGYLSIVAMLFSTIGYVICTFASAKCSIHSRIVVPIVCVVALLGITVALVDINTDDWQSAFCIISLACAGLMNGLTAFFAASAFGIAGLVHRKLIQAIMLGQAVSGIISSVAKILTIIVDTAETTSALYYFIVALGMMVLCVVLYLVLPRTVYFRFHMARVSRFRMSRINDASLPKDQKSLWAVTKSVKIYALSVIFVFIGTLSVFPAVASLVVSVDRHSMSPWTGKFFSPFACFLLYNVGDFCGRCVASSLPIPATRSGLVLMISIVRLVYIPLLLLCNVQPRSHLPVVIDNDLGFVIMIATFALSNGYLASVCMANVPKIVKPEHQESASILMALFMALGITLGALLSSPLLRLL